MSKQQYNTAYGWPITHLRAQQATQPQLLNEFINTMPAPPDRRATDKECTMRVKILRTDNRLDIKAGEAYTAQRWSADKVTLLAREPDGFDPECNQYLNEVSHWINSEWQFVDNNTYIPESHIINAVDSGPDGASIPVDEECPACDKLGGVWTSEYKHSHPDIHFGMCSYCENIFRF